MIITEVDWKDRGRVPNEGKDCFWNDFDHLLMMRVSKIDEGWGSSANGDLFCFSLYITLVVIMYYYEHFAKNSFPKSIFSWGFPNTYIHWQWLFSSFCLTNDLPFLLLILAELSSKSQGWIMNNFFPIGEFPYYSSRVIKMN